MRHINITRRLKSASPEHLNQAKSDGSVSVPQKELTRSEAELLRQYENIIRKGFETFFDVGAALLAIRTAQLYRMEFGTFDEYCRKRWGFGRTYAWRVMGAAERLKLLPANDDMPRPTSEFQMRPFLKLKPQEFPEAWKRVIETAKDGRITSQGIVKVVVQRQDAPKRERLGDHAARHISLRSSSVGEILMLLHEIRRRIESNQAQSAFEPLERIERLLFAARKAPP